MPEIEVKPSSQGGITDENRGIKIPTKSQEVSNYKLPGYKLESQTIDLYPQTSQKKVVTRLDEKPYSEMMPGVLATELHYQPKGEGPEISEDYVGLMDKPTKLPPKPVERLSDPERGINNKGIESSVPKKQDQPKRVSSKVRIGKITLSPTKQPPSRPAPPIQPPPLLEESEPGSSEEQVLSPEECKDILDKLKWSKLIGHAPLIFTGIVADELMKPILFRLALLGLIDLKKYRKLLDESSSEAMVDSFLDGFGFGPMIHLLKLGLDTREIWKLKKMIQDEIAFSKREMDLGEGVRLVCKPLSTRDKAFRSKNSLFREVAKKYASKVGKSMNEIIDNDFDRRMVEKFVENEERRANGYPALDW